MANFGSFSGEPITKWLTDPNAPDRAMELEADFWYRGPDLVRWDAPENSIIDGASIPRVLWSLVGSPFDGDYRLASIVHDVACERRERPWQDTHRMFYTACRAGGTKALRAKLMYGAVYAFGPRWTLATPLDTRTEPDFGWQGSELTQSTAESAVAPLERPGVLSRPPRKQPAVKRPSDPERQLYSPQEQEQLVLDLKRHLESKRSVPALSAIEKYVDKKL